MTIKMTTESQKNLLIPKFQPIPRMQNTEERQMAPKCTIYLSKITFPSMCETSTATILQVATDLYHICYYMHVEYENGIQLSY